MNIEFSVYTLYVPNILLYFLLVKFCSFTKHLWVAKVKVEGAFPLWTSCLPGYPSQSLRVLWDSVANFRKGNVSKSDLFCFWAEESKSWWASPKRSFWWWPWRAHGIREVLWVGSTGKSRKHSEWHWMLCGSKISHCLLVFWDILVYVLV